MKTHNKIWDTIQHATNTGIEVDTGGDFRLIVNGLTQSRVYNLDDVIFDYMGKDYEPALTILEAAKSGAIAFTEDTGFYANAI